MADIKLYNGFGLGYIDGSSANIKQRTSSTINFKINSIDITNVDSSTVNVINNFYCVDFPHDINTTEPVYTINDENTRIQNFISKTPWYDYENSVNVKNLKTKKASYSLLRANPKLTGNIKVVVDSKSDIYLDTFKVNETLSKKRYRHVPINSNDYYGENVMSVFRNVPNDILYYVPNEYKTIFTTTNKLENQYIDTYRCGASINNDKLYSENFSILSPLCINDTLPDFFLIFRVNNVVDIDSTDGTDTMKYLLKNGKLIKSVDLRNHTNIGKYIETIKAKAKDVICPIYVTQNTDNLNMYTGISVEKGVISKFYESGVSDKSENQTAMDNFYTNAFERNKIVSSNTVNLEFMFDDDSDQFSINTYFGLYVTLNEAVDDFYCLGKNNDEYIFNIEKDDYSIFNIIPDNDVLYCYNSIDDCRRITNENKSTIIDDYILKLGENLMSTTTKSIERVDNFITIKLNDTLQPGEHLKVLCKYNGDMPIDNNDKIYEIIMSSDPIYKKYDKNVSRVIENLYNYENKTIEIKRCCVYTDYREDITNKNEYIASQIDSIYKAFNKFENKQFTVLNKTNNSLSIVSNNDDYEYTFQRINGIIAPDVNNIETALTENGDETVMTYFGDYVINGIVINTTTSESPVYTEDNIIYNIHNFEILGARISYIVDFMRLDEQIDYKVYEINPSVITNDIIYKNLLYKNSSVAGTRGKLYEKFAINYKDSSLYTKTIEVNIVQSYNNLNTKLCRVKEDAEMYKFDLFEPYMINIGLCGILSVKDYNFYVLDSSNLINYDVSSHIYDSSISSIESIRHYIKYEDTSSNIDNTDSSLNEYITDYLYNNGITHSSVSLTSPHCCKWVAPATTDDITCDKYKLFNNPGTYLSIIDGSIGNIKMESIKALNLIFDSSGNNMRTAILNEKEMLSTITNTYGEKEIKCYTIDKNTLEFISSGIKFRLTTNDSNIINMYDFNNYTIGFVKDEPSGNENPMEMFIDNANKTILLIYYNNMTSNEIDSERKFTQISTPTKSKDLYVDVNDYLIININDTSAYENINSVMLVSDNYMMYGTCDTSLSNRTTIYLNDTSCYYSIKTDINGGIDYEVEYVTNDLLDKIANDDTNIKFFAISLDVITDPIITTTDILSNLSNIGIFISDGDGYQDYSNLKDIIKINIIEPTDMKMPNGLDGSIYQTYYEPETTDIFVFEAYDVSIYKNSKYGNIKLNKVNNLTQMWINKYTEDTNYCFSSDTSGYNALSIDYIKDYNIMTSSWNTKFFKKYSRLDANTFTNKYEPGYKNLSNIKTFFNSNAMILKNKTYNSILIDRWTKTTTNNKKNTVIFNITESLINKIYTSKTFNGTWYKLGLNNNTDKINYIKNNILKIININTTNKVSVYFKEDGVNGFVNSLNTSEKENFTLANNIKNELIFSNGSYYMTIYMNNATKGKYYIEYNINV